VAKLSRKKARWTTSIFDIGPRSCISRAGDANCLAIALRYGNLAASFEKLDGAFVLLRCSARFECSKILASARLRVLLTWVKAIAPVFQLSDHMLYLKR
jgi:hypothetical protein